ncbi:hypothetical protein BGZ76_005474 [Entomortierella beljakovae]|nr:hypothetical protein BGZ76_005474 [Entomortierella beljakovae]
MSSLETYIDIEYHYNHTQKLRDYSSIGQVATAAVSVYIPSVLCTMSNLGDSKPSRRLHNLKIKQKTLIQPWSEYRRALEQHKPDDDRDMESSIPPKKGISDAEIQYFIQSMGNVREAKMVTTTGHSGIIMTLEI